MSNIHTTNKETLKFRLKRREGFWIKKVETLTLEGLNQKLEEDFLQTDFLKRVREIHQSQSSLPVCQFSFLMFKILPPFQYMKNCLLSNILILHSLQEASNILVILILKLTCV